MASSTAARDWTTTGSGSARRSVWAKRVWTGAADGLSLNSSLGGASESAAFHGDSARGRDREVPSGLGLLSAALRCLLVAPAEAVEARAERFDVATYNDHGPLSVESLACTTF
jgi:hypothetical protein